jgi:predicted glutamine amidotransferase
MCGLVGIYSSNMLNKHKEVLNSLLYLDTWRGKDSTGVAAIRHNADTHVLKSTVPGYEFVEHPRFNDFLKLNDFCWIGHNRFGTMGKNIKTNAHPFEILDDDGACLLVGAHNGTLKNKHNLVDHAQFGTDSEALFNQIAHTSLEETIPQIDGAWALTYYDHIAEELRFIRNKERPFCFAYEEGKKTMIWASEAWMIRIAMSRSGLKLHDDRVYTTEVDTLYMFPAPMKMNDELSYTTKGGLAGKAPAFFQGRQNWQQNQQGRREWTGGATGPSSKEGASQTNQSSQQGQTPKVIGIPPSTSQSGTPTPGLGEKQTPTNVISLPQQSSVKSDNTLGAKTYKGYGGRPLSRREIEDQLKGGCSWCELESIQISDRHAWFDDGKPVCGMCISDTHPATSTIKYAKHSIN